MLEKRACTVGILRPPEIAQSEFFRDAIGDEAWKKRGLQLESRSMGQKRYAWCMDDRVDEMRDMFTEAACELNQRVRITEYQLFVLDNVMQIMGPKRSRLAKNNDVLATIDATPSRVQFIAGLAKNAAQRALLAFSDWHDLQDSMGILGSYKLPTFDSPGKAVNRVFAMHTPLNTDEAATSYRANLPVVRSALAYPNIPPIKTTQFSEGMKILNQDNNLSDTQNRSLFVEDWTDRRR